MRIKLIPLLLLNSLLFGCTPIEKTAYRVAVGSKVFLDSIKKAHPECTQAMQTVPKICTLLVQATAAKDLLIDAGETYCGGGTFETGGACNPPKKSDSKYQIALTKLQAALSNYEQTEKDLRGAIQ